MPGLEALDDRGVRHAAALAHGLQAESSADRVELVDEGSEQAGARRAESVPEGDRSSAWVESRGVRPELGGPGERHRRERLVDLVGVEVVDRESGALEDAPRGCLLYTSPSPRD